VFSCITTCICAGACSSPFGSPADSDAGAALREGAAVFPENQHAYRVVVVNDGITWTKANTAAESVNGHLATITTESENRFVWTLVTKEQDALRPSGASFYGPWIGGMQQRYSLEPNGGWSWVTGERWGYTHWLPGEPNNDSGGGGGGGGGGGPGPGPGPTPNADRVHYYSVGSSLDPTWADAPDARVLPAYVVEWE
jgi:hypothetical protein